MKVAKKIAFAIISMFFMLLLSYNIYNFVCVNIFKQDITTIGGYGLLEVVSGSMEPTIQVGDLIVINTKDKDYKVGDIVTFYDIDGSFVTHRIVFLDGDQMRTKGDNNNSEDELTNTSEIVGKYKFKIGGGGRLLTVLKSPLTMSMIFVIGLLVCFLISMDKEERKIPEGQKKEYQKFQDYLEKKDDYEIIQEYLKKHKKKIAKKREKASKKEKSSKSSDEEEK